MALQASQEEGKSEERPEDEVQITVNRVTPSMNDQQPYHVELVSVFLKQGFVFLVFCTYDLVFLSRSMFSVSYRAL